MGSFVTFLKDRENWSEPSGTPHHRVEIPSISEGQEIAFGERKCC